MKVIFVFFIIIILFLLSSQYGCLNNQTRRKCKVYFFNLDSNQGHYDLISNLSENFFEHFPYIFIQIEIGTHHALINKIRVISHDISIALCSFINKKSYNICTTVTKMQTKVN